MTAGNSTRVPWRWHLAWFVLRVVPDIKGRAWLFRLLRGRSAPSGEFDVSLSNGVRLHAVLPYEPHIWFLRQRTPLLGPVLDRVLSAGDTFVDVGANIGLYSCWAAHVVGETGRVLAFEPVPVTRDRLSANVRLNDADAVVEVRGEAVGAETGSLEIFYRPDALGLASSHRPEEGAIRVSTPQTTLDVAIGDLMPKLLKIDVEGHELEVLSGAHGLLGAANPPVIAVEIMGRHLERAGHTAGDVLDLLEAHSYEVLSITHKGLVPWRESPHGNALALRPEHAEVRASLARVAYSRAQD